MPLDPRIDWQRMRNLVKVIEGSEFEQAQAAAARNFVKELKRSGVYNEWMGNNDGIVEEELWFPYEMLETTQARRSRV